MQKISIIASIIVLSLVAGCVNNGNTHTHYLSGKNAEIPLDKGNAITRSTHTTIIDGKTNSAIDTLEQTPLAVKKDVMVEVARDARDIEVAKAGGGSKRGFWSNLWNGPQQPHGYCGGTYYSSGPGSGGWSMPCGGGGGSFTTR